MLLKLILVVTCLCAAQASYIIQAPDTSNENANPEQNEVEIKKDNSENTNKLNAEKLTDDFNFPLASEEVASVFASARACTNNVCNNLCRYLGYNWGQCISADTCRCYRSALALEVNADPEDIEVKTNIVDKEDSNILYTENDNAADDFNIPISAKGAEARACTDNVCNSLCHNLGYQWGHCISATTCRCYRYGFTENANAGESIVEGNEIDNDSGDDDEIIESGYKAFLGNPVETLNEINQEGDAMNEVNEGPALLEQNIVSKSRSLSDCNALWCAQTCRRNGFPDGVCVNGRCKCDIL